MRQIVRNVENTYYLLRIPFSRSYSDMSMPYPVNTRYGTHQDPNEPSCQGIPFGLS
jgi:hypothetical protein